MNSESNNSSKKNINIHILPNTMPKKYLKDVMTLCAKNSFPIQEKFT